MFSECTKFRQQSQPHKSKRENVREDGSVACGIASRCACVHTCTSLPSTGLSKDSVILNELPV